MKTFFFQTPFISLGVYLALAMVCFPESLIKNDSWRLGPPIQGCPEAKEDLKSYSYSSFPGSQPCYHQPHQMPGKGSPT